MTKKRVSVLFILPNLTAGGAERVISFLAQELDKEKFSSSLLIVGHERDSKYNIKDIPIVYLEKARVLKGIIEIFLYLSKNKHDIVFSSAGHLNTVMAYISVLFPKTKFVAREVNVLSVLHTFHKRKILNFSFFSRRRFKFFDKIVCQSIDMLNDLNKHYKINQDKLVVINNPITKGFNVKVKANKKDKIRFITVASFKKQKGHERIIKALYNLDIPFEYTMVGNGQEKDNIFELINKLGLAHKITHIPWTNEVDKYLSESDIFLQGSYVEGFPNCLIESCAVGTPVIAFDAPGGLNEILIEGINGYIVYDELDFLNKIHLLDKKKLDPKVVSTSVYKKYSQKIILKKYEELLISLTK